MVAAAHSLPADPCDPRRLRSPLVCALAELYLRRYLCRHFHALRVAQDGFPRTPDHRPVVICSNHPSWWDPAMFALLTRLLFPERSGYGPMEETSLTQYRILRRIGVFGIQPGTSRGAARFLNVCRTLLRDPATILWITAEGTFADARARPLRLRPGVAHLASYAETAVILPLALEFVFWNERKPEALVRFGPPVVPATRTVAGWQLALQQALTATMDRLAADSVSREPARFVKLLSSRSGIGGVYDQWRRARAWVAGRRFDPSHQGGE